mmetsp:Transcript_31734/g.53535  ORF Transcript_31734/g.53535 Transcript_31734/m.53535 type:complete len:284 (-) Transcript_31734:82-933(-)
MRVASLTAMLLSVLHRMIFADFGKMTQNETNVPESQRQLARTSKNQNKYAEDIPIISLGMPMSHSKKIWFFLNNCGCSIRAVHMMSDKCNSTTFPIPPVKLANGIMWKSIQKSDMEGKCFIAALIQRAMVDGKRPLEYVFQQRVNAALQLDSTLNGMNVWPQIDALDTILEAYPNALYIHHVRDIYDQALSIIKWNDLAERFQRNGLLGRFPGQGSQKTMAQNVEILLKHARDKVRQAFLIRPNHRYLEVDVGTDPDAGEKISVFVGALEVKSLDEFGGMVNT